MEQPQIKNDIKLFLEGKLNNAREIKLLEWVKQSPGNKQYFYKIQQSLDEELRTGTDASTRMHWEKLLCRAAPQKEAKNTVDLTLKKYHLYTAPVAAAFLVGFVLAALFTWYLAKPGTTPVTQQKVSTPYGARTQFTLPDSSIVWLNSGSELIFPSKFQDKRPVKLVGEAFFKVKKSGIPFIVYTEYGNVEVKGTSFDVKAYRDDSFETTLVAGKVNVFAGEREGATLCPGSQAVLSEKGLQVKTVDTELFTSWKEGKLIFSKEYLPQLAQKLERWYNVKIEMDNDPRLNNICYSGTIEMETFCEVLNLLRVTAPVDYTWNDKTRVIKLFYKKK